MRAIRVVSFNVNSFNDRDSAGDSESRWVSTVSASHVCEYQGSAGREANTPFMNLLTVLYSPHVLLSPIFTIVEMADLAVFRAE